MSQSLARALRLMISMSDGDRSLEQLADELGVHKSTALRLLRTLEDERFVHHDDRHRYRLGSRLFELANRALEQRAVLSVAHPYLVELNRVTTQTIHLAVYESGQAIYVDKLDSKHSVRLYSRVGLTAPLHCTAVGKVLVAALPPAQREAVARSLDYVRMTENTNRDAATYLVELERVARQGFSADHGEHESFVNCLAVPIRDGTGAVVAAVSVTVPTIVLDYQGMLELLPIVRDTADAISADLGWRPSPTRKAPT